MQLKNKKIKITGALASATCALLGAPNLQAAEGDAGWKIDTAYMMYSEKDRVDAQEPTIKAQKTFADDSKLNLNLVLDTLTGASPSGAAPSNVAQTFTTPSGAGFYEAPAGDLPLDDTFHDTRTQIGASWDAPIGRLMRYNVGLNISSEHDYQSTSVNGGLSYDFNKKNTTLAVGLSYAADSINPEGGAPIPLSQMDIVGGTLVNKAGDETKDVIDMVLGVTQVIDARTIMQFNLSLSESSGYLNDPYKVVSIVDATTGVPLDVASGGVIYEARPDSRSKQSIYWDTKHHTTWGDTVDVSYRYMMDDWGINSHTIDMNYRWNFAEKMYLQPHVRWYTQTEADFYRHNLVDGEVMPQEVSADYRLAEFDAITVGAKFGYLFTPDNELNFRVENYQQTGNVSSKDLVGIQSNYDAYPDLDAMIFQIGYSFKF
jgi:hypothetical protein